MLEVASNLLEYEGVVAAYGVMLLFLGSSAKMFKGEGCVL